MQKQSTIYIRPGQLQVTSSSSSRFMSSSSRFMSAVCRPRTVAHSSSQETTSASMSPNVLPPKHSIPTSTPRLQSRINQPLDTPRISERGSLHAIIDENPSMKLFIHPLEWQEHYLGYLSSETGTLHVITSPGHISARSEEIVQLSERFSQQAGPGLMNPQGTISSLKRLLRCRGWFSLSKLPRSSSFLESVVYLSFIFDHIRALNPLPEPNTSTGTENTTSVDILEAEK